MAGDGDVLRALAGGEWARKLKWPPRGPPTTSWDGVQEVENGRVTKLWLFIKGLTGSIPKELGNLTNLRVLALYNNELTGSIPKELGYLSNLTHLYLHKNKLTGEIPKELGNLTNLAGLALNNNKLEGPIPASVIGLLGRSLQSLSLSKNAGLTLPEDIGTQAHLTKLNLSGQGITGGIPPELGQLQSLQYLNLHENYLTGSIPSELGRLTNLTELNLSENYLSGSIPPELGNLTNLVKLWIGGPLYVYGEGKLTGSIPSELGRLINLTDLQLSYNQLSGSIPSELGRLMNLTDLHLYDNQLSGSIPSELGQIQKLEWLNLSENKLTGSIPKELGQLQKLQKLWLRDNQLTGPIPSELGSLSKLVILHLDKNNLSGSIPRELGNLTNLSYLYLYSNKLEGSIPSELGRLTNLTKLNLSENYLSGSIPKELGNFTDLRVLRLAGNKLTGSIPPELGNLTSLNELSLFDNQLTGSIASELGSLSKLAVFCLEKNNLSGPIPFELDQLVSLTDFECVGNPLLTGGPTSRLQGRDAVKQWQNTLAGRRREAEAERRRAEEGSPFFKALSISSGHPAVLIERLCPLVSSVPELQLFFTLTCAARRQGVLDDSQRNSYIRQGLEWAAEKVPTSSENIAVFKLALEEAQRLGAINRQQYHVLDNKAEVKRMEHAHFVKNMQECIRANTVAIQQLAGRLDAHGAAIAQLGRRVDAHDTAIAATHKALMDFRSAYQKKLRAEASVGMLKMVINAVSFGIGGGVIDAVFAESINGIIDFSDSGVVQQCLEVSCLSAFDPASLLKGTSAADAKEMIFGAMDSYADNVGDEALDGATRGHIAIKIIAVAAASCIDMTTPPVVATPVLTTSAAPLPPLPPSAPQRLTEVLAQHGLSRLERLLADAGFESLGALKELALDGKKDFMKVLQEDVGIQKVGDRLELWSMVNSR